MTDGGERMHPLDQAVYQSRSPRVAVQGTRYGHGACTVLWIKASDDGWVLLPHGMPTLAIHLQASELTTMLDGLRDRLWLKEAIGMGRDGDDDRTDDKPGRHEDDREGQVHEDTAKKIDPRRFDTDDDDG